MIITYLFTSFALVNSFAHEFAPVAWTIIHVHDSRNRSVLLIKAVIPRGSDLCSPDCRCDPSNRSIQLTLNNGPGVRLAPSRISSPAYKTLLLEFLQPVGIVREERITGTISYCINAGSGCMCDSYAFKVGVHE